LGVADQSQPCPPQTAAHRFERRRTNRCDFRHRMTEHQMQRQRLGLRRRQLIAQLTKQLETRTGEDLRFDVRLGIGDFIRVRMLTFRHVTLTGAESAPGVHSRLERDATSKMLHRRFAAKPPKRPEQFDRALLRDVFDVWMAQPEHAAHDPQDLGGQVGQQRAQGDDIAIDGRVSQRTKLVLNPESWLDSGADQANEAQHR